MKLLVRKYTARTGDRVVTDYAGEAAFAYFGQEDALKPYFDQVEVGKPDGQFTEFDVPAPEEAT